MSDLTDPDRDHLEDVRRHGRWLLRLGIFGLVVGLFASAGGSDDRSMGMNWIIAGGVTLLAGAHLLQGACRR